MQSGDRVFGRTLAPKSWVRLSPLACLRLLWSANLRNADLWRANLRGVENIETAQFNEKTRLPNGDNWIPETDMTRYTNPEYPKFFEPIWAKKERGCGGN